MLSEERRLLSKIDRIHNKLERTQDSYERYKLRVELRLLHRRLQLETQKRIEPME